MVSNIIYRDATAEPHGADGLNNRSLLFHDSEGKNFQLALSLWTQRG